MISQTNKAPRILALQPSSEMPSSWVPHNHCHSTSARQWIHPNSDCLKDGFYLNNTFTVNASAFPEEHISNRCGMKLVLTREEDFDTLLEDLDLMFGRQGTPKLYLCRKISGLRDCAIKEQNLAHSLIQLRTWPTKWSIDIEFPRRPKAVQFCSQVKEEEIEEDEEDSEEGGLAKKSRGS